jgi:hypothetical protein
MKKVICLLDGKYALALRTANPWSRPGPQWQKSDYYIESDGVKYFASEKKGLGTARQPRAPQPRDLLQTTPRSEVHEAFICSFPRSTCGFPGGGGDLQDPPSRPVTSAQRMNESRLGVIFPAASIPFRCQSASAGRPHSMLLHGTEDSGDIIAARAVADLSGLPLTNLAHR